MKKSDDVSWSWGKGSAEGKIEQKFEKDVEKKIKGSTVKRKATKEEPAFLIKQENGSKVLKSESELSKSKK